MFGFLCCCTKDRKDGTGDGVSSINGLQLESKSPNINMLMIEFVQEEAQLGIRDVQCVYLIEELMSKSNHFEVDSKDVAKLYQTLPNVDKSQIKAFMTKSFFFYTDNTTTKYDLERLICFNILYAAGSYEDKSKLLFNMIESRNDELTVKGGRGGALGYYLSQKMVTVMEYLTHIPTVVVGKIVSINKSKKSMEYDANLKELLELYVKNSNIMREFAV